MLTLSIVTARPPVSWLYCETEVGASTACRRLSSFGTGSLQPVTAAGPVTHLAAASARDAAQPPSLEPPPGGRQQRGLRAPSSAPHMIMAQRRRRAYVHVWRSMTRGYAATSLCWDLGPKQINMFGLNWSIPLQEVRQYVPKVTPMPPPS